MDERVVSVQPSYELTLLGGFDLRRNDRAVSVPNCAQRVLAFLAIARTPRRRIEIAGSLWPEAAEKQALHDLRSCLWRLQRAAPDVVDVDRTEIRTGSCVRVDIDFVTRLARSAAAGSPASDSVPELIGLGELLPGWYDDWVIAERERLRMLLLTSLEGIAERSLSTGDLHAAEIAGREAVVIEPLRETSQHLLLRVLLARGNAAEAIGRLRAYRELLREALGVTPSEELERLLAPVTSA